MTSGFRRILVAFDGSPNAERALAAAAALAGMAGGELTALSVVPEVSAWMLSGGMGAPVDIPELQDDATRAMTGDLDRAVEALAGDVGVTKIVEVGGPGRTSWNARRPASTTSWSSGLGDAARPPLYSLAASVSTSRTGARSRF